MKAARALGHALLAALPLLTGCSTTSAMLHPASWLDHKVVNHDIPVAKGLDAARTRKLFLILVRGLRQQGRSRAALAFLTDYNRRFPGDPEALRLQADCLFDIAAYDRAGALYAQLRAGPQAAAANAGLGRIAAERRDWPQAVRWFTAATSLAPTNADDVNNLGFALIRTGHYRHGLNLLRQATQLDPASRIIRNNLILGLTLAGQEPKAARLVRDIKNPRDRAQAGKLLLVTTAANAPMTSALPAQQEQAP